MERRGKTVLFYLNDEWKAAFDKMREILEHKDNSSLVKEALKHLAMDRQMDSVIDMMVDGDRASKENQLKGLEKAREVLAGRRKSCEPHGKSPGSLPET